MRLLAPASLTLCVVLGAVGPSRPQTPAPAPATAANACERIGGKAPPLDKPAQLCRYTEYRQGNVGRFAILNGSVANPQDYPAQFYYQGQDGLCTASLVASQTVLTAGHCVFEGEQFTTTVSAWAKPMATATCNKADFADAAPRMDIALCHFNKPVAGPYQTVNRYPERVAGIPKDKVILVGFGCGSHAEPDPRHPIFRKGNTSIAKIEDGAILTKGGAALCLGDSGGPAFVDIGGGQRLQIAVNSRAQDGDGSWLSLTSAQPALDFVNLWVTTHDVTQHICGIDPRATHCS